MWVRLPAPASGRAPPERNRMPQRFHAETEISAMHQRLPEGFARHVSRERPPSARDSPDEESGPSVRPQLDESAIDDRARSLAAAIHDRLAETIAAQAESARTAAQEATKQAFMLRMEAAAAEEHVLSLKGRARRRRARALADAAGAEAEAAQRRVEAVSAELSAALSELGMIARTQGQPAHVRQPAAAETVQSTVRGSELQPAVVPPPGHARDAEGGSSREETTAQRRPRLPGAEVGKPLTPSEREAHQRGIELRQQALTLARSSADKWAGTAGVLFAALGLATLVQGGKQIRALDNSYEPFVAGGVLVAFALAVGAIAAAAFAAQRASPTTMSSLTATELLTYEADEAQKVQSRLSVSRAALLVAIALVIAVVAALLYVPRDQGRASRLLVVTRTGEIVCGQQAKSSRGDALIKTRTGALQLVKSGEVVSVTAVRSCPGP